MLSVTERVIFLRSVPFFEDAPFHQLTALATACVEEAYPEGAKVMAVGDDLRALCMVVSGQVKLTYAAGQRTLEEMVGQGLYFGEAYMFEASPIDFSAVATDETTLLRLAAEPLYTVMKTDLSLSNAIIRTLSQRLREKNEAAAGMTRKHSRKMHQIFDKLDE